MKKFKGFTLIELIVVIAIIGVLAAILVPAMMGWVRKANINSANSNAKSVFTNAQTVAQEFETKGIAVDGISAWDGAAASGANPSDTVIPAGGTALTFVQEVNLAMTSSNANSAWAVVSSDNTVLGAVYSNNGLNNMGAYPNACPTDSARTFNSLSLSIASDTTQNW